MSNQYWVESYVKDGFEYKYTNCKKEIEKDFEQKIVDDLGRLMPNYNVAQYFGSQPGIFDSYDHMCISFDSHSDVVGMIASKWLNNGDFDFLYIWTAMIANELRGTNVFSNLVKLHFNRVLCKEEVRPKVIVTKTYNPIVYRILHTFCRTKGVRMYPDIIEGKYVDQQRNIAKKVAEVVAKNLEYSLEKSIVYGGQAAVAPDYFPYMQKTKNGKVWDYFQKNLTRDDQVLCIIEITEDGIPEVIRKNKWNDLNKDSSDEQTEPKVQNPYV